MCRDHAPLAELRLSAKHLRLLANEVVATIPREVCGFLGGLERDVRAVLPVPNIAPDPIRQFVMDPRLQWHAMRSLYERGWRILAIYHSHPPGGQSELSASDVANVTFPEALNLLILPDEWGRISRLRAFAIDAGRVCEVSIAITS